MALISALVVAVRVDFQVSEEFAHVRLDLPWAVRRNQQCLHRHHEHKKARVGHGREERGAVEVERQALSRRVVRPEFVRCRDRRDRSICAGHVGWAAVVALGVFATTTSR